MTGLMRFFHPGSVITTFVITWFATCNRCVILFLPSAVHSVNCLRPTDESRHYVRINFNS